MTKSKQMGLFEVNLRFVKILNDIVSSGAMAEMGASAFMVLVAVRSFVPISGTSSFPSQQTIAEHTGLSVTTVKRSLKRLEELGWLEKRSVGKRNVYATYDFVRASSTDLETRPDYELRFPYGALASKNVDPDIRQFAKSGTLPPSSPVSARPINVVLQVVIGDHGTNLNIGSGSGGGDLEAELAQLPPELRERFASAVESFRQLGDGTEKQ